MSASFREILLIVALVLESPARLPSLISSSVSLARSLAMPSAPCSAECTSGAVSSTNTPIHEHSFVRTLLKSLSSFELGAETSILAE
jgi:hypothetical protein